VEVTATERDGIVTIEVAADSARAERAEIWVLPVLRSQTIQIGRGENGGRSVTYSNVVRALHRVGEWTGEAARVEVPLATAQGEADGYVILLQAGGKKPGPILGAAKSAGL
jgi:hypothetical protein